MDHAEFWTIVESSKATSGGSFDGYADSLASRLEALPPEKIIAFQRTFDELRNKAYSWDLWGAAYVIGGGCSDDAFTDFRSWLISMGRETYEKALVDPESLATVTIGPNGEEDAFFEEFAYMAARAYEEKTGRNMTYESASSPAEPSGIEWEEDGDDLAQRYPKLHAKYGES
ncbi:hypothetical protein BWI17_02310 [Betaproteobacteria bacterium GR16-43]|nr:hypothetical protein BWI17_02310 [Betaproteobacteria bacterium GR16-43]